MLEQFPNLAAWEKRVAAIGHGRAEDLSSKDALEIARRASPQAAGETDCDDPQGLAPGQMVSVVPDVDGGDPSVEGRIAGVSIDTIAISRSAPEVGDITVHFPRVGYRVTPME
jgi:hypothetical protein